MATQTTTTLVDDIDGTPAEDTYTFGLDGVSYEIDLSEKNAKKLNDSLSAFVAAARRSDGSRRSPRGRGRQAKAAHPAARVIPDREQTTAIRNWARSQGLTVSDRGRLSQSILDAFDTAH